MINQFQLLVQNTADTKDFSDYTLSIDLSSNPGGLQVYVDGQSVVNGIIFSELNYGSYEIEVEVYRGPTAYEYDPVTLSFGSVCDNAISSSLTLSVSYVRTCAMAEFASSFDTFTVSSLKFAWNGMHICFTD